MSKVVVVGLGYVGLVVAIAAAEAGHDVVGIDTDYIKIDKLRACTTYIEDVTNEQLRNVVGKFAAAHTSTRLLEDFDIAVIAVPTPLRDKVPDLSYVESAGRIVAEYLTPGATVILESTTYPGTTEGLLADVIAGVSSLRPGVHYHLGFSPERIDPGNKTHTLKNTPKLVSGVDVVSLEKIREFYDTFVDETVPVSSPKVAEITKLYENIFANVNIALVNELAMLCDQLGIDVWEMIDAGQTKGHSMYPWFPGPGVGGHCLPIDGSYLAWLSRTSLNTPLRFIELADEVNGNMPHYAVNRLMHILNDQGLPMKGSSILVVGVTYKPGSNDLRESPALDVIRLLQERGAEVTITDPYITGWTATPQLDVDDIARAEDFTAVMVVTNHPDYDYAKLAETARIVFDTRHSMDASDKVVYL